MSEFKYNPVITIISATYNHSPIWLRHHLDSLLLQTDNRWHEIVVHDGSCRSEDQEARLSAYDTRKTIQPYLDEYPHLFTYLESEERQGFWGHRSRELALPYVKTPWLAMTNADNTFLPQWSQRINEAIDLYDQEGQFDMLIWPILHNYWGYHIEAPVMNPEPKLNCIDFANFCVKTDVAMKLGFPYSDRAADGVWVEDLIANVENIKIGRIPLVLAVHN